MTTLPKPTCRIEGCTRPVVARGLCTTCHQRLRRHGKLLPLTLTTRFWNKVDKGTRHDGCWLWTGTTLSGYGTIRGEGKPRVATHVSWFLHHGEWPNDLGLWVLHKCDNPPCVNPAHLFLGTQQDNMRDSAKKGRKAVGEAAGGAKLTEADVRAIRRACLAGDMTREELGKKFGVHPNTIGNVVTRKTWAHV